MALPLLEIRPLGRVPFAEAHAIQRASCMARADGSLPHDLLLLCEHPSVYTLGRGTRAASLPFSVEQLASDGSDVVEIERGGDVTWHGPGQLVGYPILHLAALKEDLHWYLRELEQVLIDALASLGIAAERHPGFTGVWTDGRKIASIGIHVKRWVTMHGFALNVINELTPFRRIVPCGIEDVIMTSVAAELQRSGTRFEPQALYEHTEAAIVAATADRFARRPVNLCAVANDATGARS